MRAGQLRHRVTLESATETQNSIGEAIPTWGVVATVWAEVAPLSGREGEAARQQYATVTHRIRLRYRAGVIPKMRVTKGSRTFDIDAVLNTDERNRELICFATERNV